MPSIAAWISFLSSTGVTYWRSHGVEHVPEQLEHMIGVALGSVVGAGRLADVGHGAGAETRRRKRRSKVFAHALRHDSARGRNYGAAR